MAKDKVFRMLIGDDSYVDKRTASNAISLVLSGMALNNRSYTEGEFVNARDYAVSEFPINGFSRAEIKAVTSRDEMIEEASGNYDWIATDLNYGEGYETGGKDVLAHPNIRKNPAKKAIFTSEDNPRVLEQLAQMGADIVVSKLTMKDNELKQIALGRAIAEYYQTKGVSN